MDVHRPQRLRALRRCRRTWSTRAESLDADWLENPDPDVYTSWEEFAKQAVLGLPARRGVRARDGPVLDRVAGPVPCRAAVGGRGRDRERRAGRTRSAGVNVTGDMLHIRYQGDGRRRARATGRSRRGRTRLRSRRECCSGTRSGPRRRRRHPTVGARRTRTSSSAQQVRDLKAQWVNARSSSIGEPAVLSRRGDVDADAGQPERHGLVDLHAAERVTDRDAAWACRRSSSASPRAATR